MSNATETILAELDARIKQCDEALAGIDGLLKETDRERYRRRLLLIERVEYDIRRAELLSIKQMIVEEAKRA